MFGRKKVTQARYFSEPSVGLQAQNCAAGEDTNQIFSTLSNAVDMDVDVDVGYVFSPKHWDDPDIEAMLSVAGIVAEARGNKVPLLKSPRSVRAFGAMSPDDPKRRWLEQAGVGKLLFDPHAENGFSDEIAESQREILRGLAQEYPQAEARRCAALDFHQYSKEYLLGRTERLPD